MRKFVGACAMALALISLGHDMWRSYGVVVTLKRAAIAYFAFYAVGSLLALIFRTGIQDEWVREDWLRRKAEKELRNEARRKEEAQRLEEKQRRAAGKSSKTHRPTRDKETEAAVPVGTDRA